MLKKVGIAVAAAIIVLLVVIAMQPPAFRIERSTTIAAPADIVFAVVNDFHQWDSWSPWSKLDPNMKKSFEGPATGVGSIYSWAGNDEVGEGKMTLTESKPNEKVGMKLEFLKPFKATNQVELLLKEGQGGVTLTWVMTGENDFMGKAFSLFANMDKMVGTDFEKGLAQLKTLTEGQAQARKAEEEKRAAAAVDPAAGAPVAPEGATATP